MKKHVFVFVVFLCISFSVAGQFRIGPTVGFQLASQQVEVNFPISNKSVKYIPSYRAGVQAELFMNKNTSLQTGLAVSGRGSLQFGTDKIRLTYLEVPFILSTIVQKMRKSELLIGAGGYAAYMIDAANKRFMRLDLNKTGFYKKLDFGISAFTGVRINKQWLVSLNYTLGLMQVRNKVDPILYYDSKERNTTFHLSVAYLLQTSK
jgi:Outer membrane protein beta-barrel domain